MCVRKPEQLDEHQRWERQILAETDHRERTHRRDNRTRRGKVDRIKDGLFTMMTRIETIFETVNSLRAAAPPPSPAQPAAVQLRPGMESLKEVPLLFPQPPLLAGRQQELTEAHRRLSDPNVRFLMLTGPPGIGKTSMAHAIATQADKKSFPDGVLFVVSISRFPPQRGRWNGLWQKQPKGN